MKFRKSRLQNLEEKRSLQQAVLFFFLTLILILVLFFIGLPLVIKLSVFLGNRRFISQPPENSQLIVPVQPKLTALPNATNSALISLSGSAPSGMKVKIYLNNQFVKDLLADNEGEFLLKEVGLQEGKNVIKVITQVNDKESEPTFAMVTVKKNPPRLEVNQPVDNTTFYDEDKEITIEGVTEVQATVFVNEHLAMVDSEGNFSLRFPLKAGENEINVIAQDEAGNQSKTQLKVNYSP